MDNFFRWLAGRKQQVNKKQNVEIDGPPRSGGQGKYMKYVSFPLHPLEAVLSILNFSLFFFVKNNFYGINFKI
jgi:hypothetical protein